MTAAQWHSGASASGVGGADLTLAAPSGTVDGNLLLMTVGATAAVTIPTGGATWNEEIVGGVSGTGAKLLWKNALSEPANWTVPIAGIGNSVAQVVRISGHDPTDPIDTATGATGSLGNVVFPTLTPAQTETLLWQFLGRLANVSFTEPGTVTERYDAASSSANYRVVGGDEIVGPSPTGTRTWVPASGTAGTTGFMVAIRPLVVPSNAFLALL